MLKKAKAQAKKFAQAQGVACAAATSPERLRSTISLLKPKLPEGMELVRIGGDFDGGYLIPDVLDGVSYCLSPGVDVTAEFEKALQARGIESHLIDYSVEQPPHGFMPASFTKKFLGASTQGIFTTLSDWMADLAIGEEGDLLLQMDIEGAEYAVLLDTPAEVLKRFRVIVLELHALESLANPDFHRVFEAFAQKLTATHQVVHLHPNNILPPVSLSGVMVHPITEVTLVRRDVFDGRELLPVGKVPHPLDQANVAEKPDYPMAPDWLGS